MLYAGSGEFSIWNGNKSVYCCYYKATDKFYKHYKGLEPVEITKEEYIKKLKVFVDLVEKERI